MSRPFVIFDFDGTVADSFAESLLAYNRVAPRLHLRQVTDDEVPQLRQMGTGLMMKALGVPMWKLPQLMIAARAELHGNFHSVKPVPGIVEAIGALSAVNCRLAMVTSNSNENVRSFFSRNGIDNFETIVAGVSVLGKATRLRRLLKSVRVEAGHAAYIGDTCPDIRAGREAGTAAVAVSWGFHDARPLLEEKPDALVDSTSELSGTILRLLGER
jgi:phosphoglycolate phosphatase